MNVPPRKLSSTSDWCLHCWDLSGVFLCFISVHKCNFISLSALLAELKMEQVLNIIVKESLVAFHLLSSLFIRWSSSSNMAAGPRVNKL